jgi:ABC-type polysaccharide/polyol phosphate transport system ATPase subunit
MNAESGIMPAAASLPAKDVAIRLRHVTKTYKLYDNPVTGPIKEWLPFFRKQGFYREFTAVNDVSMDVRRGEVVGLVGPNGAGKTSLLKLVAGLLPPTSGEMTVNGKITALLALGVGVNPEFTGRENILFSGVLLGMSMAEIRAKMPAIIEFAEIGDFVDRPFRTYSTGMKARLLFSISMSVEPDIMIVDEALATGDTYFVRKCAKRVRELVDSGATILFVSHNLHQIQQLCDRAYLMMQGRLIEEGTPSRIIAAYNDMLFHEERDRLRHWANPELTLMGGSGDVVVTRVRLLDGEGQESNGFRTDEPLEIEISYRSFIEGEAALFVGFLQSKTLNYIGFFNSEVPVASPVQPSRIALQREGTIKLRLHRLLLTTNDYSLWLILYREGQTYCEYKGVSPFFVARKDNVQDRGGCFAHPAQLSHSG